MYVPPVNNKYVGQLFSEVAESLFFAMWDFYLINRVVKYMSLPSVWLSSRMFCVCCSRLPLICTVAVMSMSQISCKHSN